MNHRSRPPAPNQAALSSKLAEHLADSGRRLRFLGCSLVPAPAGKSAIVLSPIGCTSGRTHKKILPQLATECKNLLDKTLAVALH